MKFGILGVFFSVDGFPGLGTLGLVLILSAQGLDFGSLGVSGFGFWIVWFTFGEIWASCVVLNFCVLW